MVLPSGALFSLIYSMAALVLVLNAGRLPQFCLVGNRYFSPLIYQIFVLASVAPVSWFLRRIDRELDLAEASRGSMVVFRLCHGLSRGLSALSLAGLILVLLLIPFGLVGAGF